MKENKIEKANENQDLSDLACFVSEQLIIKSFYKKFGFQFNEREKPQFCKKTDTEFFNHAAKNVGSQYYVTILFTNQLLGKIINKNI